MADDANLLKDALEGLESAVSEEAQRALIERVAVELELDRLPTQTLSNAISQQQLTALWGKTPDHAVKYRPGPGGKSLAYVPHGYVEFKLNKVFGGDWDIEPQPVFNGSVFHTQQVETVGPRNQKVINYSVVVCCKLTLRVRNTETLEIVTTITKTEFGSAWWYPENEFGDALKAAESDALKRCGLRLGIALDLYYDDDRAKADKQQQVESARKLAQATKEELERKRKSTAPSTIPDILLRAKEEYGLKLAELNQLLHPGSQTANAMQQLTIDLKELGAVKFWERIGELCRPSNAVIEQPVEGKP